MHPQTSLQNFPGKINVGRKKKQHYAGKVYVRKSHTQQLREEIPLACASIAGVSGTLQL